MFASIAALRAGLVALLGVVLHELAAQILDRGGGMGGSLGGTRVGHPDVLRPSIPVLMRGPARR